MDLALANTKKRMIAETAVIPLCEHEVEEEYDIFIICTNETMCDYARSLLGRCIEDNKGKRNVRVLTLEQYEDLTSQVLSEVNDSDEQDIGFSVEDFFNHVGSEKDKTILVYSHSLDSTQTFLMNYCKTYENLVCTTDIQTEGKGRKTNAWISPEGCLMFSFNSILPTIEHVGLMQYLIALVMCEAIKQIKGVENIDINIKWPNDLFVNKQTKICGIISYATYKDSHYELVSGAGVNVSNRKPTTCIEHEVKKLTGKTIHISRGELLGRFFEIWNRYFIKFSEHGLSPFIDEYYKQWLHTNQKIRVLSDSGETIKATIKGIDNRGYLLAMDEEGNMLKLLSDGNTFNFLDGLISKKISFVYTNPQLREVCPILFKECVEDNKGKRKVLFLLLDEYKAMEMEHLTEVEVDENVDIGFSVEDFFNHLGKAKDDTILIYSHTLDSTQTFMQRYCQGYQNVICTTDIQTQGRGRKSNAWISPVGCLMYSFKSYVTDSDYIGLIQYLIAIVMCEALKQIKGVENIDINIKWPNDIYVNKQTKVCGILCQSIYANSVFDITSGVGINVSNRKPTTCIEHEVKKLTGKTIHISRGELLGRFFEIWNRYFIKFSEHGLSPFIDEYYKQWLHTNQNVNVLREDGSKMNVIIKGINDKGFLIAVDAQGNKVELLPDGNTFNFLDGLISKKL